MSDPGEDPRIRIMTEKGQNFFEQQTDSHNQQIKLSERMLEELLLTLENSKQTTLINVENTEKDLQAVFDRYSNSVNRYLDFLSRHNTTESVTEQSRFNSNCRFNELKNKVKKQFELLDEARMNIIETKSVLSQKSTGSVSSSLLLKKRAEVEAARAKMVVTEEEARLKVEQSKLAAQIELLNQKKELNAKEAEANYLAEHEHSVHSTVKSDIDRLPREPPTPHLRTAEYIQSLAPSIVTDLPQTNPIGGGPLSQLRPDVQTNETNTNSAIAHFLSRKDVLKDRLYVFGGKYEHYLAWKNTFKCVMLEVAANQAEELDLLLRWAGSASKQISSIKSANFGNPAIALSRAWERLDSQFGSPERIELALRTKLNDVPKITFKDTMKMYELSDILSEICAIKSEPKYSAMLSYLDTAAGVNPTISKLPLALQNKWRDRALSYKRSEKVLFPPFTFFCKFVHDMAVSFNDPSFDFSHLQVNAELPRPHAETRRPRQQRQTQVSVAKTSMAEENKVPCPIHKGNHELAECRSFRHKSIEERKGLLKQHGICFRCCSGKHLCKDCHQPVKCDECDLNHATAMHVYRNNKKNGGEPDLNIDSRCTEVCKNIPGKSCAKIVLVDITNRQSEMPAVRGYAIIDDQSNYSLAKPHLFDQFDVPMTETHYTLKSCGGKVSMKGRRASGFEVQSVDTHERLELPILTECEMIPDNRNEIPTPEVARSHPHLCNIADRIPELDEKAEILILIGRDLMPAHHVLDQRLGDEHQPFAQKLKLGWVIVGECCMDGSHAPKTVNSMKTYIQSNSRPSVFEPCENAFKTKDIFITTEKDNQVAPSWEDKQFTQLMSREMVQNAEGNWEAPLPFKESRPSLPNNRSYAARRTSNFIASLAKNSKKKDHTLAFMQALFEDGHAERAPEPDPDEELWYLPLFGVYHPKKKDKIRIVFDSSAKFGGVSLNEVLMTGPNLTNSLLGVLMRFRKGNVAVTADIQQMFYSFSVKKEHRNFLRFLWPEDNNLDNKMVEYRMKVHVFGNSPSPAVATYGLHKTADLAGSAEGKDMTTFVKRNFYVDDALSSHDTSEEAVDLLKRTQSALQDFGNIRLHKICSNSQDVLNAFNKEDLAKDLKDLDLESDFPLQRSLGVCWNVQLDTFTFRVVADDNAFTRRGVLSTINGLYDPLGVAAAFTITGKILLRESLAEKLDWDEPLPQEYLERWQAWKGSLEMLKEVQMPRMYCSVGTSDVQHMDLYVYCDASEKAVAAVSYLLCTDTTGNKQLGFVLGKTKVAPQHGNTIPRLELCAAVLAVEVYETCRDELDLDFRQVRFFSDSKVVLGYIFNETKRFFIYVANRVDRIRNSTTPDQWSYVPSALNPADDATRGVSAENLPESKWLKGPQHLLNQEAPTSTGQQPYPIVLPDEDREVRTLKTECSKDSVLGCQRFERFSSWSSVIRAVAILKNHIRSRSQDSITNDLVASQRQAQHEVIKALQHETFTKEIKALMNNQPLAKGSSIRNLSPFVDRDGILRVGGRLKNAQLDPNVVNPIIIPRHHLSMLLVRHFHEKVYHQGRHLTEGAIRNGGFWILGSKRQVTSCIHNCLQCRRSRGKPENPKMSDLPFDRLDPTPPFTNVGIDVFGPWQITTRRTRGGHANAKRWALMFTCLVIRAVHIELLEEMSSSCFINALRRFCALRGEVKMIRSDCGTNFVGSTTDLGANVIDVEAKPVKNYLVESGINWIFNPPHSSHFGGVWERMIGVARKILDAMLVNVKHLTHEILLTLMAEVTSIMNARPLTPVSADPDFPLPLTPATLLTMKTNHAVESFKEEDFNSKDLFKAEWRRVQHLANTFWSRWRTEYLPTLQIRRMWHEDGRNVGNGDIVLLRDNTVHRNEWPMGVIVNTNVSEDNRVRSVDVRLGKDRKVYTRPVCEVIVLLSM